MALEQMPYFARLLFALRVLDAPGLGTWAVDGGYRIYIDFDAVTGKGVGWNVDSVLHECSHLFAEHKQTAAEIGVDPSMHLVWNAAADLSINDDLDAAGCATFRAEQMLPEFLGEPNGKTPQHYLTALRAQVDSHTRCGQCGQHDRPAVLPGTGTATGTGSGPGLGTHDGIHDGAHGGRHIGVGDSAGDLEEDLDDPAADSGTGSAGQGEAVSCPSCGRNAPYLGCGSGAGGQAWIGELSLADDLDGLARAATGPEHEAVRIATAAAVQDHALKYRGAVPDGLTAIADQILAPSSTPWQKILAARVRRVIATRTGPHDIDRNRRHRRKHNVEITTATGRRKVLYPGYQEPVPTIELIRDTSGSMSEIELAVVTREVEGIAKRLGIRGDSLQITDVDATVHTSRAYTGRKQLRQVAGRGGTDMRVGIQNAQDRKHPANVIVVATDGYTPWPVERGRVPVIACIVPPYGGLASADAHVVAAVPDFIKTVLVEAPAGRYLPAPD